jgi:hypothetical protein
MDTCQPRQMSLPGSVRSFAILAVSLVILLAKTASGQSLSLQFTFGTGGSGAGQFLSPVGTAFDGAGDISVTDDNNSRVESFDSQGNYLSTFGTGGSGNGQFKDPQGIGIDTLNTGNIAVGDVSKRK